MQKKEQKKLSAVISSKKGMQLRKYNLRVVPSPLFIAYESAVDSSEVSTALYSQFLATGPSAIFAQKRTQCIPVEPVNILMMFWICWNIQKTTFNIYTKIKSMYVPHCMYCN